MSIHPDLALTRLKEGNRGFRLDPGVRSESPPDSETLTGLQRDQNPFAAILGCSDSRVPVEFVFQQDAGQLFVVRVAGNVVGPSQLGSLEFAVLSLGVRLIVVLGHSGCGAVGATLAGLATGASSEPEGHLGAITSRIARGLTDEHGGHDPDDLPSSREAVLLNIGQSLTDLMSESSILAERVQSGELKLVGALYDIESRCVSFVDDGSP